MPEHTEREWPVVDGAPLNPYDVTPAPAADPPEGDVAEDRDATSAPTDELAAAVPGPGGEPSGITSADTDDESNEDGDEKPARRRKG